ncbi:MAG: phosphotransferase [Thermodesulfobacteriota bacterium]
MLLEMHAHTSEHSSCSHVAAVDLIRMVRAKGLQGVVFTDHHYLWRDEDILGLRERADVPDEFLTFSGQEVSTSDAGDILVYGATESISRSWRLAEIREHFPQAALVWAHPYRWRKSPAARELLNPLLDAVEVLNTNHTVSENSRGLQDWFRHRFTAIAGTDTHAASYAGLYPTVFDHPVESVEALSEAVKNGRCRPFLKEIHKAGMSMHVADITGRDGLGNGERFVVKSNGGTHGWKSAERAFHIMETLYVNGFDNGRYRVPRPVHRDEQGMILMEQELPGSTLFEKVVGSGPEDGRYLVQMAARWLARLHNRGLHITPASEFLPMEEKRLGKYVAQFERCRHSHTKRARELMLAIHKSEVELFGNRPHLLIQGHGDYHPKNILVAEDKARPGDPYVAAIDFDSSYLLPPAFDVGTFLAQFHNQLFPYPQVLQRIPEEVFLYSYREAIREASEGFSRQVELFRARTNLCIASYLISLGLGDSENLWRVLVEAENAMTQFLASV